MPITIFFCYAREDEPLLDKLKAHLRPLQRQGLIEVWYDRNISPGAEWEPEVTQKLNTAQIILLLVSPDFMNSDYCYGIEMQRALERHQNGEARVIPIILRPVYWHGEPLGKLQALPTDGKPVTDPEWHNQDRAFYNVTNGIYTAITQWTLPAPTLPMVADALSPQVVQVSGISSPVQQRKIDTLITKRPAVLQTLTDNTNVVYSVAMSADGAILASGGEDKTIKVWNLSTGQQMWTLTGHRGSIDSLAMSANGTFLVSGSGSYDQTLRVWNLLTGKEVWTRDCYPARVAISADGAIIASSHWRGPIKLWSLPTGQEIPTLSGHIIGSGKCVAMSANGAFLARGGDKGQTIKVWNLSTGQEIQTFNGHADFVDSLAMSADGAILASGSRDRTVKVWNVSTGQEIQTLTGHTDSVNSVAMSADGAILVSGSYDQTVKVWEI